MSTSDANARFAHGGGAPLRGWTRREWLTHQAAAAAAVVVVPFNQWWGMYPPQANHALQGEFSPRLPQDVLTAWEELAQTGVNAAKHAGAQYAEVRLTRTIKHRLRFSEVASWQELIGVGVRALVNGYWGFTAAPGGDAAAIERLAREAVAQAKSHARGLPRMVDLGTIPPAVGRWTMPVKIDPFTVSFEEKRALLQSWVDRARQAGLVLDQVPSELHFLRQERVVATSEGSRFTQTVYESGGKVAVSPSGVGEPVWLDGFTPMGKGWELVLEANVPEQLRTVPQRSEAQRAAKANPEPVQIGRYTLVCDGVTMASLVNRTLAIATQLDRALGYEANASGTSFLNEPLAMLGQFQVASPLVTLTANRSAPGQLATVKWDDEGVVPTDFTVIKDGVLVDYQTTREQAAWLAPYYQRVGKAVRSQGCAAADSALEVPLQQTPNVALAPSPTNVTLDDLVANVQDGILVTMGEASADFQARTGILQGMMREIKNGKVGQPLEGGAVSYDTIDLWKNVIAVGGSTTQVTTASSGYPYSPALERLAGLYPVKGEPPQRTSSSVQAVAVTIRNQAVIDLMRRV